MTLAKLDARLPEAVRQFARIDPIGPFRPSAAYEASRWALSNRAWIDAEWDALPDVPRTIAGHLAARVGGE